MVPPPFPPQRARKRGARIRPGEEILYIDPVSAENTVERLTEGKKKVVHKKPPPRKANKRN
ncbi:hypothetical protein DICPUDRAFT_157632 [Dictyostelium purpureum]|uniref:Uncharacterized protein n=1 Tax=Dictyostelium purpureum TaxID=5786 RepID=F0ZZM1_DICPU|nr:uncharacterized protein DICPUDRAFT_157632 [Dictyostelium purpureum]EGC30601.1 hypothetical protein DICPUDRAFT_157632 [Dictyostelium purpureum]|eukprot:XP_003292865.1 hypothetical protein DICPUDRAFT_157632 [Dictyostelium purpureum]